MRHTDDRVTHTVDYQDTGVLSTQVGDRHTSVHGKVSTRGSGFRIVVLWCAKLCDMDTRGPPGDRAVSGVSVGPARDPSAESQQARPSVSELTLYPAGRLLVASSAWQPPGRDVRAKLSLVGSPL